MTPHDPRASDAPRPRARTEQLVVTRAGDDTLVYDLRSHQAHSLDRDAATLWRHCDGTRDLPALARLLGDESGEHDDDAARALREAVVRYTLGRLTRLGLVTDVPPASSEGRRLSRRELVKALVAAGVTVAVPAVLSVSAPNTLYAMSSCKNSPCVTDVDCANVCPGSKCVRGINQGHPVGVCQ